MNKKQVASLLKVMGKDKMDGIFMHGYIDRYDDGLVLVVTDRHKMAIIKIDEDAEPIVGKLIRREAFERWYKLATGKDRMTGAELVRLQREDEALNGEIKQEFVPWQKVLPEGLDQDAFLDDPSITFNGEFAKILQEVDGDERLTWKLHGKAMALEADTERGKYLLMPIIT